MLAALRRRAAHNGLELSCPAARATVHPFSRISGGQVTLQLSARQPGQLQRVVRQRPSASRPSLKRLFKVEGQWQSE